MKRTVSIGVVAVFMTVLAAPSFAGLHKRVEQGKGGLTKIVTSPLEVKDSTMGEYKKGKFMPFALTGGLLKGTFYMGKKVVGGAYDIVSMPLPR